MAELQFFNQAGIYNRARFFLNKKEHVHWIFFGITGSGKTVDLTGLVCQKFDYAHHKIFDLWDAMRGENCMYVLKSRFKKWKEGITNKYGKTSDARTYPTTLLYPICKKIPHELPICARPFTIPITSLTFEDLIAVNGMEATESKQNLFSTIMEFEIEGFKVTKNTTAPELLRMITTISKRPILRKDGIEIPKLTPIGISSICTAIERLIKHKIITSEACPTSIDLYDEYRQRTISSLVLTDCDEWLAKWLLQWFVRNIYKVLHENSHKRPADIVIRELADVAPRETIMPQEVQIKKAITKVLTQGIRGANLAIIADTQSPSQVDVARSQFVNVCVHQTKYADDIETFMVEESKNNFTAEDRRFVPNLLPGYCFIFTPRGRWYGYAVPPQCRIKKGDEVFIEVWKKYAEHDGWKSPIMIDIRDKLEIVDKDYSDGEKRVLDFIEIEVVKETAKRNQRQQERLSKDQREADEALERKRSLLILKRPEYVKKDEFVEIKPIVNGAEHVDKSEEDESLSRDLTPEEKKEETEESIYNMSDEEMEEVINQQ